MPERATLTAHDRAVRTIDAVYGCAIEFSHDSALRRQLYDAVEHALKEAYRRAREDAAKYHDDEARKIAALRPDGIVWTAETLNAKLEAHEASAAAIRASITTDEGKMRAGDEK